MHYFMKDIVCLRLGICWRRCLGRLRGKAIEIRVIKFMKEANTVQVDVLLFIVGNMTDRDDGRPLGIHFDYLITRPPRAV